MSSIPPASSSPSPYKASAPIPIKGAKPETDSESFVPPHKLVEQEQKDTFYVGKPPEVKREEQQLLAKLIREGKL